jgi:hypothetical protein
MRLDSFLAQTKAMPHFRPGPPEAAWNNMIDVFADRFEVLDCSDLPEDLWLCEDLYDLSRRIDLSIEERWRRIVRRLTGAFHTTH